MASSRTKRTRIHTLTPAAMLAVRMFCSMLATEKHNTAKHYTPVIITALLATEKRNTGKHYTPVIITAAC